MAVSDVRVPVEPEDVKFQLWSSSGTYGGTSYDIYAVNTATIGVEGDSSELRGDGGIIAGYSKILKATITINAAVLRDYASLAALTGAEHGSGYSAGAQTDIGAVRAPYLGLALKVLTDTDAAQIFFLWKAKLMGGFSMSMNAGEFAVGDLNFTGFLDTGNNKIMDVFDFNADTEITTFPPTIS